MMHVEPSFVLYALLLDPGCCLRAHTVLIDTVEPAEPEKRSPMQSVRALVGFQARSGVCSVEHEGACEQAAPGRSSASQSRAIAVPTGAPA